LNHVGDFFVTSSLDLFVLFHHYLLLD
jgi:hypothetical protein